MYKERILEKIAESEKSLELVESNMPDSVEVFRTMKLEKDGIYKNVEFIIQNIVDVCAILVKEFKLGVPENDDGILDKLEKNKILKKKTVDKIIQMKGFRNFLVHRYGEINDKIAFEDIMEGISGFRIIFKEIRSVLEKRDEKKFKRKV